MRLGLAWNLVSRWSGNEANSLVSFPGLHSTTERKRSLKFVCTYNAIEFTSVLLWTGETCGCAVVVAVLSTSFAPPGVTPFSLGGFGASSVSLMDGVLNFDLLPFPPATPLCSGLIVFSAAVLEGLAVLGGSTSIIVSFPFIFETLAVLVAVLPSPVEVTFGGVTVATVGGFEGTTLPTTAAGFSGFGLCNCSGCCGLPRSLLWRALTNKEIFETAAVEEVVLPAEGCVPALGPALLGVVVPNEGGGGRLMTALEENTGALLGSEPRGCTPMAGLDTLLPPPPREGGEGLPGAATTVLGVCCFVSGLGWVGSFLGLEGAICCGTEGPTVSTFVLLAGGAGSNGGLAFGGSCTPAPIVSTGFLAGGLFLKQL